MVKRFLVIFILTIVVAGLSVFGTSQQKAYADNAPEKLVKAVVNTGGGWSEIIKQPIVGAKEPNKNPVWGGVVGLFNGIGKAVKRTGGGIVDGITFWDGNESLVKTYPLQE